MKNLSTSSLKPETDEPPCIKCCLVGDTGVGKTSTIIRYAKRHFPKDYETTIFDTYAVDVTVDDEPYVLGMFDTAGDKYYEALRAFAYAQCQVYVVCFSVVDPASLENVEKIWIPEILRYNRKRRPIILVGTQTDKRYEESVSTSDVISRLEGQIAAAACGASAYVECCALTDSKVRDVFDEVVVSATSQLRKKRSKLGVIIRRLSDRIKNRKT